MTGSSCKNRKMLLLAVPVLQLVLYVILIAIGNAQVRALDDYIAELSKYHVSIDIEKTTPVCHEIAFGLNGPILFGVLCLRLIFKNWPDADHSIAIQSVVACIVPFFWFGISRWASSTKDRLRSTGLMVKLVKGFGLILLAAMAAGATWIIRYSHAPDPIISTFTAAWVSLGLFDLAACLVKRPDQTAPTSDVSSS